jgi:hypothetical protein
MRVLVVMQHINFFRNLEPVVRELDARGHETIVLHGSRPADGKPKMVHAGRGIEVAGAEIASLTTGYRPVPGEFLQRRLRTGRQVMNRGLYLQRGHPSPDRVVDGIGRSLSPVVRTCIEAAPVRALLRSRHALPAWRRFERASPASRGVTSVLEALAPDVVVVSPAVWPKHPVEADYIHAANRLGIPTVGYLNSWDNLTSKGTVHVLPDVFIVWNEALATEAEEIHRIPREIIRVTGAPHLDHFFELSARRSVCADGGPYIVYLCSSRTLIADETHIVTGLADALARELAGGAPTVVVRPHPVNAEPWEGYDHPGTAVYPRLGDQADTPASWQEYFDQLSGASAFVGLNTTAFLEAAVADRPCLTIVSDEFFDQQGRTGHFRHLLAADFLEVCADVGEVAARVAGVLGGADEKAAGRRRFAKEFLRPRGIRTPARSVVADTIEELVAPGAGPAPRASAPAEPVAIAVLAASDDA